MEFGLFSMPVAAALALAAVGTRAAGPKPRITWRDVQAYVKPKYDQTNLWDQEAGFQVKHRFGKFKVKANIGDDPARPFHHSAKPGSALGLRSDVDICGAIKLSAYTKTSYNLRGPWKQAFGVAHKFPCFHQVAISASLAYQLGYPLSQHSKQGWQVTVSFAYPLGR